MQEGVKKYKCSSCRLLLSVPPIMVAKDGDKSLYKCGRCERTDVDKYPWTRNDIFEEIAQDLHFPCSYPPCTESLAWGKVQEHEENCPYKTIKCPLSAECGCSDEIRVDLFGEHAVNMHEDVTTKAKTVENNWQVHNNSDSIFFVELDKEYFFVYIQHQYSIAVMTAKRSKYTKFNVTFKIKPEDNFAAIVTDLPIIHYKNDISGTNFLTSVSNEASKAICSSNEYISIGVTFVVDETRDLDAFLKKAEEPEKMRLLLKEKAFNKALSCPYCMTYMKAPIYACVKGHTICSACKARLQTCPTCRASLNGPRIFTLEGMVDDVGPFQFKASESSSARNRSTLSTHEPGMSFLPNQNKQPSPIWGFSQPQFPKFP